MKGQQDIPHQSRADLASRKAEPASGEEGTDGLVMSAKGVD